MTAIAFDKVALELGRRVILSDVSFSIESGEFIALLGPNGAGKTTLLRAILGLVPPSGGAISVLGKQAARGNLAIGYMPQSRGGSNLRWTGWDFVASAVNGHRWGLPRLSPEDRREVAHALDLVGASDLAHRPLADLSGGERQRLLLSQTLLGRPRILLLDEPLLSLDPTHQRGVVKLVSRLQRELKLTVLFSAHEINPLLDAMDRVLYVGGGKAVIGAVEEVITSPVLSRLYGSDIEVVRTGSRIFVMAGDQECGAHEIERHEHAAHSGSLHVRV